VKYWRTMQIVWRISHVAANTLFISLNYSLRCLLQRLGRVFDAPALFGVAPLINGFEDSRTTTFVILKSYGNGSKRILEMLMRPSETNIFNCLQYSPRSLN
jgi:hypothetical protein